VKEILRQFTTVWSERTSRQKIALLFSLCLVALFLGYAMIHGSASSFTQLFPSKSLTNTQITEIRTFLERHAIVYKEDKEKGMLVPTASVEQIRNGLAEIGIPKQERGKGFELFDTNTWIKGEKELQVLEMRALKGQLEKDLCAFEHIKSASVILDIPPQRTFNGTKYSTKASVILTLMPGARLSASELKAVTNHLAGAVRGLEPNMIAISDTSGKLYKAIDPHASEDSGYDAARLFEEHMEEKISELLTRLVGQEHFYTTVQAVFDKDTQAVSSLSISVVIDKIALISSQDNFKQEIERQLAALAKGYGLEVSPVVDYIPFEQREIKKQNKEERRNLPLILTLFFIVAAFFAALFPFLKKNQKNGKKEEESLFRVMTRIDVNKLAHTIQREDPQTVAMMLSYLEPSRAEQMIAALDTELQERVLYYLSEMEKDQNDNH
jgi:flagellar M-ring protein FliF